MDQAIPDELLTDLSVRGFEALFEPVANSGLPKRAEYSSSTGSNTPLGTGATPVVVTPPQESSATTWTLRAASENLGLSPNTIRKRIRTGQLRADKVIGFNGPEWRIHPPPAAVPPAAIMPKMPETLNFSDASLDSSPTMETLLRIVEAQAKQLEIATTQLAASTEHVKAAARVIAYQQLQLEEKNNTVKLLTDSHHQDNWFVKLTRRLTNKA